MSATKVRAGQAVAAYVEDGLGRRLIVAHERSGALQNITVLAMNQSEAREVIAVLRQLAEELPPGDPR